ncbi:Beta-catenin-like protein 1 [Dichanthelium oligosanthes]|uniref:Beta-catenin-like protein 1 n=1 Tax=Dichanthelium oligosanthes TaxID=888268 RepID=A0A1E5VA75_9POAL|nr:Beta-catenin-like protein 1 [Dichanthelium oligosanthes]
MDAAAAHKRKRPDEAAPAAGEVDLSAADAVEVLDLRAAKRLLLAFERRLRDNLEARMKYPDDPARFADSEIALHAEADRLRLLAGAPELFPDLVPIGLASSLASLLTHDNADLAAAAASLLADLTDSDDPSDLPDVQALADALVDANALDLLVHNLSRFSEADPDEAEAVHNTLAVLENLLDLRPHLADKVCDGTKLLRWLLSRLKAREFDANKQYASEILAILLQNSPANQKRLGQINGVDGLLQAVAMYKSRDPKTSDEEEMLENLFDCLCCVLMPLENKERFVKAEGVELMIIIMKQKKLAYSSAIRTLDFAMTRFPPACERFVDVLGLKTAFAAFMDSRQQEEQERELSGGLFYVFYLYLSLGGITKGSRRMRLLGKFVENECEKIDRLMEFYTRYSDRVKEETERLDSLDLEDLEMDDDERYNRKLEAGLYTLQLVALILGHIWHSGNSQMRARVELLLRQHKLTKQDVKDILEKKKGRQYLVGCCWKATPPLHSVIMYYPHLAVSVSLATAAAAHPFLPAPRRHSSLLHSTPPLPRRTKRRSAIAAVSVQGGGGGNGNDDDDDFFTVDFDPEEYAAESESDDDSPWEGALVYRRDAAVHHLEYATTLERLGLGDLSSHDSRARAAAMGLGALGQPQTPVLVSLDVTRRRGRLRLDGIARTVITLGCFRCAEPAPEGIFANFSLLLTEDPVEEPDLVDLGTIYEEDIAKGGASLTGTLDEDDQDVDWDDRLHFPAGDKEIDISKHIRDIIHLEITMDAVCSPACKGLCLACGANLNTCSCSCSNDKPQEPKGVKGRGPLKELLKPIQKRR